jgi:hypothetical protein
MSKNDSLRLTQQQCRSEAGAEGSVAPSKKYIGIFYVMKEGLITIYYIFYK